MSKRRFSGLPACRKGFTLVEVLTVVVIIAILMALLYPALQRARIAAMNAKCRAELEQLVQALENFRTQIGGGEYPPDGTNPGDSQAFMARNFPRSSAAAPPCDPSTALTTWLGPCSADPVNPTFYGTGAVPANTTQIGPFFDFDKTRLVTNQNGGITYLPPNNKPTSLPYLYFKAVAGTYGVSNSAAKFLVTDPVTQKTFNVQPFVSSAGTSAATTTYVASTSYQLLSPGVAGTYGGVVPGSTNGTILQTTDYLPPVYPAGTNYTPVCEGTQANFTNKPTVGDDKP